MYGTRCAGFSLNVRNVKRLISPSCLVNDAAIHTRTSYLSSALTPSQVCYDPSPKHSPQLKNNQVQGHRRTISCSAGPQNFGRNPANSLPKHRKHTNEYCTSANQEQGEKQYSTTIDQEEVDKFSVLSKSWWSASGEFKALHSLNELRVPWIRDALSKQDPEDHPSRTKPLAGLSILDVGCGGGILCEPLARLGATVHGIDASAENIEMAKYHAGLDPSLSNVLSYQCAAIEDLSTTEQYNAVIASEIIEHVLDPKNFVTVCCSLVKDGGSIFFTTINKTLLSRVLAVYAAEYILRIVPAGAHDWEKFISPEDLQFILSQNQFSIRLVHGMLLNPCTMKWSWTGDNSMNYALHATKHSVY